MQLPRDGPKDPPILRLSSYQRPQQGQRSTKQRACHVPHLHPHTGYLERGKDRSPSAGWPITGRCVLCVQVFLEGVKAALTADAKYNGGNYSPDDKPIVGLKAFGRVYAGELSQYVYHSLHVPRCSTCSHGKWHLIKGRHFTEYRALAL